MKKHKNHADQKNFACVIHGNMYDWRYVENLYNMLQVNTRHEVKFHVFTEPSRPVPAPMIKHDLINWPGISGPKKAWWYKMQMFDPAHVPGNLLYMDLDVVITGSIDWIWGLSPHHFWAVRDFRHLWRPSWTGLNSSIMYWDTERWKRIWASFQTRNILDTARQFHGDQDFLNVAVDFKDRRFFDSDAVQSWRWQIKDGGLDIKTRTYRRPNTGTVLDPKTSVMIFHGSPKPHEITDSVVSGYWNTVQTK
jgi:hypothetical protein